MEIHELLEYEPKLGTKVDELIFKKLSNEGFSLVRLRPNGKQADREKKWQQFCKIYRKYDDIPREINENMGIAIGPASGVICIDVDNIPLFVEWGIKNNISLDEAYIHGTIKGIHLFYRRNDNLPKINRLSNKNIGIDIMLDRSQVVAPGSIVIDEKGSWQYSIIKNNVMNIYPDWVYQLIIPDEDIFSFLKEKWDEILINPPIKGERNNLLFKILCNARNKGAEKKILLTFAEKYASFTDLTEEEVVRTVESVLTKKVNYLNKIKNIKVDSPLKLDVIAMMEGVMDEVKISNEIAEFWFDKYRFCLSNRNWYVNENNIWTDMGVGRSPNPLEPIIEYLYYFMSNEECKKELTKLYKKYQNFLTYTHLIGFLKNNYLLSISENEFDNNLMMLPLKNSIIEFNQDTIKVRSIEWNDFIRKTIPLDWSYQFGVYTKNDLKNLFDKESIKFDRILSDIFKNNLDCKILLIKLLGYALSGTNKKIKLLPILIGSGNNGKSILFRILQSSFYPLAITVTKNLVLNKNDIEDKPRPEMLVLQGTRIGLIGESDDSDFLNESTVKALTGGDIRSARNLYSKEMVQINPTYTLFLATNHEPKVVGGGKALWDRLLPIPFKTKFVNEIQNEEDEILIDETIWDWASKPHLGVLLYLLVGWLDYASNGLGKIPESINLYKKEYKDDEDQYSDFRDECLEQSLDIKDQISFRELCRAYRNWCNDNQISINNRLSDRSIKRGIINSLREWEIQEKFLHINKKTVRGITNLLFRYNIKEQYANARPIKYR